MSFLSKLFGVSPKYSKPNRGVSTPRIRNNGYPTITQGRKDPNSKRSNKFGPKKD